MRTIVALLAWKPRPAGCPDHDSALMTAVAASPDLFLRTGLRILRGAGLRVGELRDLELSAVVDYGLAGSWLKVPLGKLATERMVPLDAATLQALDAWARQRGSHRPLTHPGRASRPTSCSPPTAARSAPPAFASGCSPQPPKQA